MGYGKYEIPRPDQTGDETMQRGYYVRDICHHPKCSKQIDRGFAYLCYSCTYYFCGAHLTIGGWTFECFAGSSSQACIMCANFDIQPNKEEEHE